MRMLVNGVALDSGEYRQQLAKGVPSLSVIREVQERTGLPLAKARDVVWQMMLLRGWPLMRRRWPCGRHP